MKQEQGRDLQWRFKQMSGGASFALYTPQCIYNFVVNCVFIRSFDLKCRGHGGGQPSLPERIVEKSKFSVYSEAHDVPTSESRFS